MILMLLLKILARLYLGSNLISRNRSQESTDQKIMMNSTVRWKRKNTIQMWVKGWLSSAKGYGWFGFRENLDLPRLGGGGEEGQTLKSKQITIQILQNVKTNIYALTHGYYIRTTHIIASIHTWYICACVCTHRQINIPINN